MPETTLSDDPTELVRNVIERGFNGRDADLVRAAFADEIDSRLGTIPTDRIIEEMNRELAAYSDEPFEVQQTWEVDGTVFVRFTLSGRFEGELVVGEDAVLEPTGETFEAPGLFHVHVEDGEITAFHNYFDRFSGFRQMGVVPSLEELAE